MEVDSPSIGGWTMEYATGEAQKGPVLLESPLKGMISSSKLQVIQSDMRKRAREEITTVPASTTTI